MRRVLCFFKACLRKALRAAEDAGVDAEDLKASDFRGISDL